MEDDSPMPVLNDDNSMALEVDSLPFYMEAKLPEKVFDVYKCTGGKVVCRGLDNAPIVKPGDGFECHSIESMPGVQGFEPGKSIKAWVCPFEDGCSCGAVKCKKDESCYNDQCIPVKVLDEG